MARKTMDQIRAESPAAYPLAADLLLLRRAGIDYAIEAEELAATATATMYGALGEDTDDTATLQAMIDAVEAKTSLSTNSESGDCYIPAGAYVLNDTLTITRPLTMIGAGSGDRSVSPLGSGRGRTIFLAGPGLVDKPMIRIVAPNVNEFLHGGAIKGITLLGVENASYGIHGSSLSYWDIDVAVYRCRLAGMRLDDGNQALGQYNKIALHYVWGANALCQNSHALWIKGDFVGNPQNQIRSLTGLIYNGDGLRLEGDVDNTIVYHTSVAGQAPGTGRNIAMVANVGVPRCNVLLYCSGGLIFFDNGTYGNRIVTTTSETTSLDISGTGQYHIDGIVDYITGGMWGTNKYKLQDTRHVPVRDMQLLGSAVAGQVASLYPCVDMPDAVNSKVTFSFPGPADWHNGKIVNVVAYVACDAAAAGNVRFRLTTGCYAVGVDNITTPETTQDFTVTPSAAAYVPLNLPMVLAVPQDFTRGNYVTMTLERLGGDGADTKAATLKLLGLNIIYNGTGPTSVGSGVIDQTSMGT